MSVASHFIEGLRFATLVATICILAFPGCGRRDTKTSTDSASGVEQPPEGELPVISAAELNRLVRESSEPVLVEFGVNFNCVRCDKMRSHMGRLAGEFEGRAMVVRVDFNANRQLVAHYGGNICPTYVLFCNGKPLLTRSYPTSVDLLAADLNAAATRTGHQAPPSANGG